LIGWRHRDCFTTFAPNERHAGRHLVVNIGHSVKAT
jgi:hypothetical protein